MQFLRDSAYQAHDGTGRLEVSASNGYEVKVFVFRFADAHQILDLADHLRAVGNTMLRDAPRPTP